MDKRQTSSDLYNYLFTKLIREYHEILHDIALIPKVDFECIYIVFYSKNIDVLKDHTLGSVLSFYSSEDIIYFYRVSIEEIDELINKFVEGFIFGNKLYNHEKNDDDDDVGFDAVDNWIREIYENLVDILQDNSL